MSVSSFDELIKNVQESNDKNKARKKIAVMCADDEEVLLAVEEARKNNIADSFLVGNKTNIERIAKACNVDINNFEIIDSQNPQEAGLICTKLINEGKASVMMKGLVGTADYMRAILNKEDGLRTGSLLSHLAVFDLPSYHKILSVTDAAVNISPSVEDRVKIINNSRKVLNALGVSKPKVAAIAAVEKENEKMPATMEAKQLSDMAKKGEIEGVYVDGPFALDVAISKHAAKVKKLDNMDVPGDADLILADDIESGNMIYKALCNFGQGKSAAIVAGAKVPVVLTSRSDTHEAKYLSIVLAIAAC